MTGFCMKFYTGPKVVKIINEFFCVYISVKWRMENFKIRLAHTVCCWQLGCKKVLTLDSITRLGSVVNIKSMLEEEKNAY